jgi:hypothetical protein
VPCNSNFVSLQSPESKYFSRTSWLQHGEKTSNKRRFIDDEAVEDVDISESDDVFDVDGIIPTQPPSPVRFRATKNVVTPVRGGHTQKHDDADKKIRSTIAFNPRKSKKLYKAQHIRGEGGKAFNVRNDMAAKHSLAESDDEEEAFVVGNNVAAKNGLAESDDEEEAFVVGSKVAAKHSLAKSEDEEEEDISFEILDTNYKAGESEPHAGVLSLAIKDVKAPEPRLDRMGQQKWPHRLFVILTKDNTLIATLFLPKMEDVGVNEYPLRMILKHAQFQDIRKAVKFHKLAPMVSGSNPNIALLNGREKDNGPRNCILRLLHPHCTVNKDMIKDWGQNVAKLIERFGSAGRFDSFYYFAGDLTPHAPKELACYITLSEVFKIMEARHQNQTIHQLLDDKNVARLYIPHHLMSDAKELASASHPTNGTDAFLNGLAI